MTNKKSVLNNTDKPAKSFFEQFLDNVIFEQVDSSRTLLEAAQKLGFNNPEGLTRADYKCNNCGAVHWGAAHRRCLWQKTLAL